jgi:hypothetical protein
LQYEEAKTAAKSRKVMNIHERNYGKIIERDE